MHKFVLFCKSYIGDFERLRILVESYSRFNRDKIPFYISVPRADYQFIYEQFRNKPIILLIDEEICNDLVTETGDWFTPGYINQEIIKLTFWKTNIAENYFCIDSDSYFIRNFYYEDFMYDEETPYSVLFEDKELCVDPIYYQAFWASRSESLKEIKRRIGLTEPRLLTCHNNTTFSSKVLESFETNFMRVNKLSLLDVLRISPFEFSWYNFWLQKSKVISIIAIEPLFKMFHLKEHYLNYCEREITEEDISRAYIGICVNTSWAKQEEDLFIYECNRRVQGENKIEKLKAKVKNKLPRILQFTRGVYRFFRRRLVKTASIDVQIEEDYDQYLERTIYRKNIPLMKDAFSNEYFVHHGVFSGMKYIQGSSGSALLPKIVGSYEEPIQKWVKEIIDSGKYSRILDIGCAEGYYAVGFALKLPNAQIFAYDVDTKAREKVTKMIDLNGVKNVTVEAECTFDELNLMSQKGTLIFCDIEGAEKSLLDPIKVSNLLVADILVESHDCVDASITDLLIERFHKTHIIEIIVDYPGRLKRYEIPNRVSSADYEELINEHRADAMRWLYMKSLS